MYSGRARALLKEISENDARLLLARSRQMSEIHGASWYKKYIKHRCCLGQIAVAGQAKGAGVLRGMLTEVGERCREERRDLVLETFTRANVPIYGHFGFILVETRESAELSLCGILYD